MLNFFQYHLPPIILMGVIFRLSCIESLGNTPSLFAHQDKLFHFLIFSILAFLLSRSFFYSKSLLLSKKFFILAFFTTATYGLTDEIHQSYVPGRTSDFADYLADCLGGLFGSLFYLKLPKTKQNI